MKSIYYILLVSICLSSCQKSVNNKQNVEYYKVDFANSTTTPTLFNDNFELQEHIKLETDSVALISDILSLVISDDRVFISDFSDQVFFFDRDGKKINILFSGKGANEFLEVTDIQFDEINKELYVCSSMQNKMFVYDEDGNYKREWSLPIPINNFFLIGSDEIVCCSNFVGNEASKSAKENCFDQIFVLHKSGDKSKDKWDIVYRGFPFNKKHNGYVTSLFMTGPFYQFDNNLYLMFPFETNVYQFDSEELAFNKRLNVDFGKNSIPDGFLEDVDMSNIMKILDREHSILGWGDYYMDTELFCFSTVFEKQKKTVIYNRITEEISI